MLSNLRILAALALTTGVMQAADIFEQPRDLVTASLLPQNLIAGPLWAVGPTVETFGFNCHYTVRSSVGNFTPDCNVQLWDTLREIQAIATINQLSQTKAFSNAATKAASQPLKAASALIEHPVDTVGKIPQGAAKFVSSTIARVNEGLKGAPQSRHQDAMALDMVGFSAVKRALAARLQVDPYSANKTLQDALNKLAWSAYAGQMGVQVATSFIPVAAVSYGVAGLNMSDALTSRIVDNSPTDLRILDRKDLEGLGIPKETIAKYFQATTYSPTRTAMLVESLKQLRGVGGLADFLKTASTADNDVQAIFFQRVAQMLATYHWRVRPLEKIVFLYGFPAAVTTDGRLVAMLSYDYVWWTPRAEQVALALQSYPVRLAGQPGACEIWITGQFSPLAQRQLTAIGCTPRPGAMALLATKF